MTRVTDGPARLVGARDRHAATAALHAFITTDFRPRSGGSWLLAVKDNIDVAGLPTTGGVAALAAHRPVRDATAVHRLRRAGAHIVGKTNLDELAYGATGDNHWAGRVAHPLDPARIVGGSSAGTAVAVATGVADAGLGTETGCSVRTPAALCGLYGFRPTTGRYPLDGVIPVSPTRDTLGLMARDLTTIRTLDAVIVDEREKGLDNAPDSAPRVGIPLLPFYSGLAPDLRSAVDRLLAQLSVAGWELVVADLPTRALELHARCARTIPFHETPAAMTGYLTRAALPLTFADLAAAVDNPGIAATLNRLVRDPVPEPVYRRTRTRDRPALQALLHRFFHQHALDALLLPTSPITAPILTGCDRIEVGGEEVSAFDTFLRTTDMSSCLGWPAITVPAPRDADGLPFGMDLQTLPGRDLSLLRLAARAARLWNPETL
ncbi:mandelamide amidase [Nocardia tenerifensis]|uniref:Mandelamide amidase n=1 Tax=Nocardia tenerifensis TaxID=228006 RepID=A0A318KQ57_9NOCA|nr:amidase family protein [Nocardia tenerifensis]PXX71770.1 mandelamide amidase [Nocardia tenerifensis]